MATRKSAVKKTARKTTAKKAVGKKAVKKAASKKAASKRTYTKNPLRLDTEAFSNMMSRPAFSKISLVTPKGKRNVVEVHHADKGLLVSVSTTKVRTLRGLAAVILKHMPKETGAHFPTLEDKGSLRAHSVPRGALAPSPTTGVPIGETPIGTPYEKASASVERLQDLTKSLAVIEALRPDLTKAANILAFEATVQDIRLRDSLGFSECAVFSSKPRAGFYMDHPNGWNAPAAGRSVSLRTHLAASQSGFWAAIGAPGAAMYLPGPKEFLTELAERLMSLGSDLLDEADKIRVEPAATAMYADGHEFPAGTIDPMMDPHGYGDSRNGAGESEQED